MLALRRSFIDPIMAQDPSDYLSAVKDINTRALPDGTIVAPKLLRLERDGYSIDKVIMVTAETEKAGPFSIGLFRLSDPSELTELGHPQHAHSLILHKDFALSDDLILRTGIDTWPSLFSATAEDIKEHLSYLGYPLQYALRFKALIDDDTAAVFEVTDNIAAIA
jgi:hypothetical protein